ncbi:nicotinate-nucleotide--dimethylbenzimidazole phosphoribosyltransferase [Vibrio albus]|uniref:Nicotinate-nucleotide--dimethylbenzimidazole phosphoribosyltransferase n=1 Tax=Vibrio albus TaxID=2200953 RepID=A0A2U3B621_9VIBR|nr:nicotinate-nucleotide--dimethylbenzimidazole phosphoribosyltransferase [Vibrio albus]PWI32239.1 nicotinate-nucleotide--dimethylbenzimidazole phosphoribosyltransferase [Vibrio albus]
MNPLLAELAAAILPVDEKSRQHARNHVDQLIKPLGSLGLLEQLACQLAAIYRTTNWKVGPKKIFVMAGDHGVYDEGVAVSPQEVTAIQAGNNVRGLTGVSVLSQSNGVEVEMIDVGIDCDPIEGITNMKVARGCGNILKEPAMTYAQTEQLILDVANHVKQSIDHDQLGVIGVGELGIANTTPAAAIVSVVTGHEPESVVGLGANLPECRLKHKVNVVTEAIALHCPNSQDGVDIMAKVGGFDLAAMTGAMLGAAAMKTPVVLDGFLSYASALVACLIEPNVAGYFIPSHQSAEKGAVLALEHLKLEPFIHMGLRLGEGSGAALAMPFLDAAHAMYYRMGTLQATGINLPDPV